MPRISRKQWIQTWLRAIGVCGLLAVLLSGDDTPSHAYEANPTHRLLAERTVELAARDTKYADLMVFSQKIQQAVVEEDEAPRFLAHFYDPDTGQGLPRNTYSEEYGKWKGGPNLPIASATRFMSALEWGRNGMPDGMDWEGAIDSYGYTSAEQEHAYTALGHVLHLLQDMAQPDHASDRPHPPVAKELGVTSYVGYETLWQLETGSKEIPGWYKGTSPVPITRLDDAFDELARESKTQEQALHLLMPGDAALGLAPIRIDRIMTAASDLPEGVIQRFAQTYLPNAAKNHAAFHDSLWDYYEINMPIQPTIPYPPKGDPRTEAHLQLGRRLLQRAEEYGAGLLRFFHDIVIPPPYVRSVGIKQEGQVKYRGSWVPSGSGSSATRTLDAYESDKLKEDEDAEVTIYFGETNVTDVQVWVQAEKGLEGANSCSGNLLSGRLSSDSDLPGGNMWKGTFKPKEDGTLCITARDVRNHYQQRITTGVDLDAKPASLAYAGATPPYEWTGYEPGADTNHSFHVAKEPIRAWRGTYEAEYKGTLEFFQPNRARTITINYDYSLKSSPFVLELHPDIEGLYQGNADAKLSWQYTFRATFVPPLKDYECSDGKFYEEQFQESGEYNGSVRPGFVLHTGEHGADSFSFNPSLDNPQIVRPMIYFCGDHQKPAEHDGTFTLPTHEILTGTISSGIIAVTIDDMLNADHNILDIGPDDVIKQEPKWKITLHLQAVKKND